MQKVKERKRVNVSGDIKTHMTLIHLMQAYAWGDLHIEDMKDRIKRPNVNKKAMQLYIQKNIEFKTKLSAHLSFLGVRLDDDEAYEISARISDAVLDLANLSHADRNEIYDMVSEKLGNKTAYTVSSSDIMKEILLKMKEQGVNAKKIMMQPCNGALFITANFDTIEDEVATHRIIADLNTDWQMPVNLIVKK